jgi:DNA-binding CsgD family transcriptional regulator
MQPVRWQRGVADLRRLCEAGLGVEEFRAESLLRLRSLLTIDAAFYATVDPATMVMTSVLTEEPLAAAAARFLDNEYGSDDVNKFTTLAEAVHPVGSLDQATRGDRRSSSRYRDLMATMGLGDEARAVLRSRGQCWGVLCLHRENGHNGFDADEVALLGDVAPHLGEGLRRATAISSTATGDAIIGGPGVLILDAQLRLVSSNRQVQQWLAEVHNSEWPSSIPLPVAVMSAAAAAGERGEDDLQPRSTLVRRCPGGWMTVHASRLSGGRSDTVVVLDSPDPDELIPYALAAHGLTAAQCRVAALVLRGRSTQQIVNELGISAYTVQEHLGAVFERFGIGSRRELVAALTARRRARDTPSIHSARSIPTSTQ